MCINCLQNDHIKKLIKMNFYVQNNKNNKNTEFKNIQSLQFFYSN